MPFRLRIALVLVVATCLAVGIPLLWYHANLRPVSRAKHGGVVFRVGPGQGASTIGHLLQTKGLIRSGLAFDILARRTNLASRLQAGTYRVAAFESPLTILRRFAAGHVADVRVTIPEGLTAKQISTLLRDHQAIASTDRFLSFVKAHGLEGRLFPETYMVPLGSSESNVALMMRARFDEQVSTDLGDSFLNSKRLRDVLILASIVEREAKVPNDRPLVASVFTNRLKIGKKLESCATVEYALGRNKERLLYKDLKIESPYNTYIHSGLPPGPICNPGLASLRAAANPAKTDYLYFVLGENGRHVFSRDFSSHVSAAQRSGKGAK